MAVQTATNPDTGERFALVDNEWIPFSKTASNPDTGEKFGLVKNEWMPLAIKAPPPEPPKAGPQVLPESDTSSDFVRGITNYIPQMRSFLGSTEALAGVGLSKLGATETGKSLIESGLKGMEAGEASTVTKESDDFLNAWHKGIGTVVTKWLPYMAGAGVANVAETLGFATLGALAGTALEPGAGTATGAIAGMVSKKMIESGIAEAGKAILEKEGKEAAKAYVEKETNKLLAKTLTEAEAKAYSGAGAKAIGSTAGMATQAGLYGAGMVGERAFNEEKRRAEQEGRPFDPENIDMSRVVPAALVHSVAGYLFNKIGLDSLKIGEKATNSMALDIAKNIAITGAEQIPAAELQTIATRYGANLSLTDADALSEYANMAAGALGMGIIPSTYGGYKTHMAGQKEKALTEQKNIQDQNKNTKEPDVTHKENIDKINATAKPEDLALLTPATPIEEATKAAEVKPAETKADETKPTEVKPAEPTEMTVDQRIAARTAELEELINKREALGQQPRLRKNSSENTKQLWRQINDLDAEILDVKQALGFLHLSKEDQNAGKPIADTGGASPAVAVTTDTGTPARTVAPAEPRRVADTGPAIVTTDGGTKLQSAPVKGSDVSGKPERVDTTPGYVRTKQSDDENLHAAMELATKYETQEDEDRKAHLSESLGKSVSKYNISPEMREEYELTRQAKREEGVIIPEWNDLTPVEKDVYFDNIRRNTIEEHNQAADALAKYRDERHGDESLSPAQQRLVRAYEENRAISGRLFNVDFPPWKELHPDEKQVYLEQIVNNAGLQQDVGFAHLGVRLLERKREMARAEKAALVERIAARQAEIEREHQKRKAELDKLYESQRRWLGSSILPAEAIKQIEQNNVHGVLQHLRTKAVSAINRAVAQAIFQMKLNTEIKLVDKLPGNDKATYDPVTDTILVTRSNATETVVMHELVHAATVKVINNFLNGRYKQLTPDQLDAAEHLNDIMTDTKRLLGKEFPDAYKNLYEFVSYAMTNRMFQDSLNRLRQSEQGYTTTILPTKKSMWSEFKLSIAKIIGATKDLFRRQNLNMESPVNYFMEVSAAFEDILSVPKKGEIDMPPLPTVGQSEGIEGRNPKYDPDRNEKPVGVAEIKKVLTTAEGWRRISTWLVSNRTDSKYLHDINDLAEKIVRDTSKKFNNWHEWAVLSTALGDNFYINRVQDLEASLQKKIQDYAVLSGKTPEEVLNQLHRVGEALHENERRFILWLLSVPLKTEKILSQNGKMISPADRRTQIIGDPRRNEPGLIHKLALDEAQAKNLRDELERLANNHADEFGDSPRRSVSMVGKPMSTDINSASYNSLGLEKAEVDLRKQQLADMHRDRPEQYKALMDIFEATKGLHDVTTELNEIGKYWSMPVANIVKLYAFDHYLPFKGKDERGKTDVLEQMLDFNSKRNGSELQEKAHAMGGRESIANNPILQSISDAIRSAARAGRSNYTESIKNAIEAGMIPGGSVADHFEFWERESDKANKYKGEKYIYHYNTDGSLDILKIDNQRLMNSIRRTYQDSNTLLDMANRVTGFFGALHTRYNFNFAPVNFVRHSLLSAYTLAIDRGPIEAVRYATTLAGHIVANNGLPKAFKVAALTEEGTPESQALLAKMAKEDPFVKNMMEYLDYGGKTTIMESFSLKSNLQKLNDSVGKKGFITKLDQFHTLIDAWNSMFEFTSRAAAFAIEKEKALKDEIAKGTSNVKGPNGEPSLAEKAAGTKAATYTKEILNFEEMGTHSRALGAFYMFVRPSAISAKRTIEAIAPAFRKIDDVVAGLPPNIQEDPVAKAKFIENYTEKQRNARVMIAALSGFGYAIYTMAAMMAPDDEMGRNSVKTDNMDMWTRSARFHIPNEVASSLGMGRDVVFQTPWGFGPGAFAAAGAQVAGMAQGATSIKNGMSNIIFTIAAESFMPIPLSRMPFAESPGRYVIDSILPTVFRPLNEFYMNKNGIGQDINSASARRMGDAYTGGDKIPEIYKTISTSLFKNSLGDIDISPNTLYFLTNSYIDGLGKLGELSYNAYNLSKGAKEFSPKTDLPVFGSFFGAKVSVDSREFTSVEKQIKEMQRKITTFDTTDPVSAMKYDVKHPMDRSIVDIYTQQKAQLDSLRQEANKIRNAGMTPKQRDQMLRMYIFEENMMKHGMIQMFKAYGVKPDL